MKEQLLAQSGNNLNFMVIGLVILAVIGIASIIKGTIDTLKRGKNRGGKLLMVIGSLTILFVVYWFMKVVFKM